MKTTKPINLDKELRLGDLSMPCVATLLARQIIRFLRYVGSDVSGIDLGTVCSEIVYYTMRAWARTGCTLAMGMTTRHETLVVLMI